MRHAEETTAVAGVAGLSIVVSGGVPISSDCGVLAKSRVLFSIPEAPSVLR
jgi:hypothetical protein